MVWDGIRPIAQNCPCDICRSMEDVERKHIPTTTCTISSRERTGEYRQSNLCAKCRSEGWVVGETADFHRLSYYNFKTEPIQIKSV